MQEGIDWRVLMPVKGMLPGRGLLFVIQYIRLTKDALRKLRKVSAMKMLPKNVTPRIAPQHIPTQKR